MNTSPRRLYVFKNLTHPLVLRLCVSLVPARLYYTCTIYPLHTNFNLRVSFFSLHKQFFYTIFRYVWYDIGYNLITVIFYSINDMRRVCAFDWFDPLRFSAIHRFFVLFFFYLCRALLAFRCTDTTRIKWTKKTMFVRFNLKF